MQKKKCQGKKLIKFSQGGNWSLKKMNSLILTQILNLNIREI